MMSLCRTLIMWWGSREAHRLLRGAALVIGRQGSSGSRSSADWVWFKSYPACVTIQTTCSLSRYSLFFCFFWSSVSGFFLISHFSCFMLWFFIWTTGVTNLHRGKRYLTNKCDVMIWLCVCVQQVCVSMCVPVVKLCSMYRPGLMEENTGSFFKIRAKLDYLREKPFIFIQ